MECALDNNAQELNHSDPAELTKKGNDEQSTENPQRESSHEMSQKTCCATPPSKLHYEEALPLELHENKPLFKVITNSYVKKPNGRSTRDPNRHSRMQRKQGMEQTLSEEYLESIGLEKMLYSGTTRVPFKIYEAYSMRRMAALRAEVDRIKLRGDPTRRQLYKMYLC